jgi:RNA-directed DNA polymerase
MRKREGMEPRYQCESVSADMLLDMEGNIKGAHLAKAPANSPGSETVARHHGRDGNSGDPMGSSREGGRVAQPANRKEARWPMGSRMPSYERGSGVTPTEQRGAQTGDRTMATPTTHRGGTLATTEVERRDNRARQDPQTRSTALMHHFTVDNLRACFESLDAKKATGVDGVTKAMYGQDLEANLQDLHQRLHQMSYRPKPVRRVEMPKADGSLRPLGISCVEDKIVQEMARRILEAIYEPVFIDTSYGFRPGRSGHDALRQRNHEVMCEPVNWIADIDLAQFFDTMPHKEILAVLSERIADRKFLRLIARMLKAGVQTPGGVVYDELGSPQGSMVSPVIANAFLDHVLDQWVVQTVRHSCRGHCTVIRDADGTPVQA